MDKEQPEQLILFYPSDDKDIKATVERLLKENSGQFPLKDLEKRLRERFHYVIRSIHSESEISDNSFFRDLKDKAYILEDGIVYQR